MKSPVVTNVDFERRGEQSGVLSIPYSHNLSGWSKIQIPIACFSHEDGPTALVMAGNHGDEYTGQIAVMRMMRELDLDEVRGRIIMIPILNVPASKAGTRLSPVDKKNLNRCFPGDPDGAPSEILADYLSRVLFPIADVIVDLHTGGRGAYFCPCAHMHLVEDLEQRKRMAAATLAFNTEFAFVYKDVAGSGLLPVEAERQKKTMVSTEMGGGEVVFRSVHRTCQEGLWNMLAHVGVLNRAPTTREELGLRPTRWVQALKDSDYLFAPETGVVEMRAEAGELVKAGQLLAVLYFPENLKRDPLRIESAASGVLIAHRGPALTLQGDFVACVAQEVDPELIATLV